jgi:hypothetical protein
VCSKPVVWIQNQCCQKKVPAFEPMSISVQSPNLNYCVTTSALMLWILRHRWRVEECSLRTMHPGQAKPEEGLCVHRAWLTDSPDMLLRLLSFQTTRSLGRGSDEQSVPLSAPGHVITYRLTLGVWVKAMSHLWLSCIQITAVWNASSINLTHSWSTHFYPRRHEFFSSTPKESFYVSAMHHFS